MYKIVKPNNQSGDHTWFVVKVLSQEAIMMSRPVLDVFPSVSMLSQSTRLIAETSSWFLDLKLLFSSNGPCPDWSAEQIHIC